MARQYNRRVQGCGGRARRVRPVLLSLWILVAAVVAGPGLQSASAAVTDRQTRTLPLPDGRAIDVELTIGDLQVTGWDRAEAAVEITRQAPSAAVLTAMPAAIDETPERVRIRIVQPDGGTDPALRSTVVLRVPRRASLSSVRVLEGRVSLTGLSGRVTAFVARGPIEASEVSGQLRLETGIGSVVLRKARLSPDGLLRLRAFNGDVRLALAERPADARILAVALNGSVQSSVPLTMKDQWGPRFGEATLGRGTPVIALDVVTGHIEISDGQARAGQP